MNRKVVIMLGILVTGVLILSLIFLPVWLACLPVLLVRPSLASPLAERFMARFTREMTRAMFGRNRVETMVKGTRI